MRLGCLIGYLLLLLLSIPPTVRADVVVEYASENAEGTVKKRVVKVKGDLLHVGFDDMVMLSHTKTLDQRAIHHGQKAYAKSTAAMAEELRKMVAEVRKRMPELRKTGKSEKVGDYQCEEWQVVIGPKLTITALATKGYPDYERIKAELAKQAEVDAPGMLYLPVVDGLVIRYTVLNEEGKTTTTMTSAKVTELAAAEFQVPAGYKETF